jgi:hypothetical protein
MIQGVVLTAVQPEKYSAAAMGMATAAEATAATDSREKCTLLYVPRAARTPKCPSSPETGARCTAPTATLSRGGRDKGSISFLSIKSPGRIGLGDITGSWEWCPVPLCDASSFLHHTMPFAFTTHKRLPMKCSLAELTRSSYNHNIVADNFEEPIKAWCLHKRSW